jgi:hypothetical protein
MTDEVVHEGESDMVTFEVFNKPELRFRILQTGETPTVRYQYDWAERGSPTPEQFERVGYLEVKLVGMMPDIEDDDVREAADEAHEAIVELKNAMCDARGLDEEQRKEVLMGNLEYLPEIAEVLRS